MKQNIVAAASGFVFALGLGISGMTDPAKVVGFLDLFGNWDPSLIFVMVGAILVHLVTYFLIRKRRTPIFSKDWHVPTSRELTPALLIGAFLFGVGWGLGGYCPGPALTSVVTLEPRVIVFVASMVLGMFAFHVLDRRYKIKR